MIGNIRVVYLVDFKRLDWETQWKFSTFQRQLHLYKTSISKGEKCEQIRNFFISNQKRKKKLDYKMHNSEFDKHHKITPTTSQL